LEIKKGRDLDPYRSRKGCRDQKKKPGLLGFALGGIGGGGKDLKKLLGEAQNERHCKLERTGTAFWEKLATKTDGSSI